MLLFYGNIKGPRRAIDKTANKQMFSCFSANSLSSRVDTRAGKAAVSASFDEHCFYRFFYIFYSINKPKKIYDMTLVQLKWFLHGLGNFSVSAIFSLI